MAILPLGETEDGYTALVEYFMGLALEQKNRSWKEGSGQSLRKKLGIYSKDLQLAGHIQRASEKTVIERAVILKSEGGPSHLDREGVLEMGNPRNPVIRELALARTVWTTGTEKMIGKSGPGPTR